MTSLFERAKFWKVSVALGAVVIAALVWIVSSTPVPPRSLQADASELKAAHLALHKLMEQPLVKSVGISKQQVEDSLAIDGPFIVAGEGAVLGHRFLTGYSERNRLHVRLVGPSEALWSVQISSSLTQGDDGSGFPSVRAFFANFLGPEAAQWIEEQAVALAANRSSEQQVKHSFGANTLTLFMDAKEDQNSAPFVSLFVRANAD